MMIYYLILKMYKSIYIDIERCLRYILLSERILRWLVISFLFFGVELNVV